MFYKPFIYASLIASANSARPDPKAPKIDGLTWTSDVSTGSVFTASLTATDPLGVDRITFSAYPNKGWWYPCPESKQFSLVNGTAFEGTWQVECPVPSGTPSQMYTFNYNCVDTESHSTSERFEFTVSGGPDAEYDAPVIEKVTCSETVSGGTMLDVYLTIADVSGVQTEMSYVQAHQTNGNMIACYTTEFVLESGVATDGVFRASCLVPADTANGEYWLEVHVYDNQKNPAEQRVDSAFQVVGGATPDHSPPTMKNLIYANSTVERGATLYFTAEISDLQSGMDHVYYQARESYSQDLLCGGDMFLKSGDMTTGVWAFSCVVPVDCMIAQFEGQVYAYDNQNNVGYGTASVKVIMPTTTV